jgi:hypothetical protein
MPSVICTRLKFKWGLHNKCHDRPDVTHQRINRHLAKISVMNGTQINTAHGWTQKIWTVSILGKAQICNPPLLNLTKLQKGVYYSGIKIFNSLPASIKNSSHNIHKFKLDLKGFLLAGSFYSLGEHFNWVLNKDFGSFYNIKWLLNLIILNQTYLFIIPLMHLISIYFFLPSMFLH